MKKRTKRKPAAETGAAVDPAAMWENVQLGSECPGMWETPEPINLEELEPINMSDMDALVFPDLENI